MEKKDAPKFNKYVAPADSLSNKDLVKAEWYLKHKSLLRKIFFTVVIIFVSILNIIGLVGWGKYLVFGTVEDQILWQETVSSVINYEPLQKYYKPIALEIDNVTVTQPALERYDFSVQIKNKNKRKIAEVDFKFVYNGGETKIATAKVLPNSERPIVLFGHQSNTFPSAVEIIIDDIRWKTIDPHDLFDVENYMRERVQIEFSNFEFLEKSEAEDRPASSILFTAKNNSDYSFWSLPVLIEMKSGGEITGYLQTSLNEFISGEERTVDLRSVARNLSVTNISAFPIADFFDIDVYMPPQVGE